MEIDENTDREDLLMEIRAALYSIRGQVFSLYYEMPKGSEWQFQALALTTTCTDILNQLAKASGEETETATPAERINSYH